MMDTSAVAGLEPVTLWLQDVSNQKSGKKYRDGGVLERHFDMQSINESNRVSLSQIPIDYLYIFSC